METLKTPAEIQKELLQASIDLMAINETILDNKDSINATAFKYFEMLVDNAMQFRRLASETFKLLRNEDIHIR